VSIIGDDTHQVARDAADSLIASGARIALVAEANPSVLPLNQKRIVITRPLEQSMEFAQELARHGALPLKIPAIQLAATSDSLAFKSTRKQLAIYDWILFTSANAVEYFWQHAGNSLIELEQAAIKIAAVGPATQNALQKHGVPVNAMPEQFEGLKIADVLGHIDGKRILLPRSAQGDDELPSALTEMGALVDILPLYSPEAAIIEEEPRLELLSGVDVVTFASGSAVRAFVACLSQDQRFTNFWSQVIVACIGPSSADAARAEGLNVPIIATEHTVAGLVAALVAYFQKGS